jgi:hypothetical protein
LKRLGHFSGVIAFTTVSLSSLMLSDRVEAKEVCIKYNGSIICGELVVKPQDSRSQSKPTQESAVEKDGMRFQSKGCKRTSRDEIDCSILVTNLGDDAMRPFFSVYTTRVVEPSGNAVLSQRVSMGTESYTNGITAVLESGIPILIKFGFRGISKDGTTVTALSVTYSLPGRSDSSITIRNINISK